MADDRKRFRPTWAWEEGDMRALGYRVIDDIVDHHLRLHSKPVSRRKPRSHYDALFSGPPPREGANPIEVLRLVEDHILTGIAHTDHPRFFGYVPSPGNYMSVLGDALASGFNVFAGHCLVGSSAAAIEATTLGWLRDLVGFPASAGGIFLSGGSMSGLSALHTARTAAMGRAGHDHSLVVYGTGETHSSLAKALRILGFDTQQFRRVATDAALAMAPPALIQAIQSDRSKGLRPFAVLATAGTTSTGAIDPLVELRRICDAHGLWLHVDGAYGAAACLVAEARGKLSGMELADSLVLDPHKWWFQPYEMGCLLVRDQRLLKAAFAVAAEYLREAAAAGVADGEGLAGDINFYDLGPQLTRSFRALKLWMFFKTFGVDAIGHAVTKGIELAERTEELISASPDWEIVTRAQLGILTFRCPHPKGRAKAAITRAVDRLLADGFALITTTEVRGETVFRACPIHPDASIDDVARSLELLAIYIK
jgi:aromatic-L-amino-acid/L-tryptophan decarboxylase